MSRPIRPRPAFLRALGRSDPPVRIQIGEQFYERVDIFKHDSWAATALYRGDSENVVCKFNRLQSLFGLPMSWLGRRLASREGLALHRLAGIPGIPAVRDKIRAEGQLLPNAVGHVFIVGRPLASKDRPAETFFAALFALVQAVHHRDMAYVDLHKRENIVVGVDGRPYLIDFQVCFGLWTRHLARNPLLQKILRALQLADLYHLAKHVRQHCDSDRPLPFELVERPWWIGVHRVVAVPLRQLRRRFLTWLAVRGAGGSAMTEAFPEDAVRNEQRQAA